MFVYIWKMFNLHNLKTSQSIWLVQAINPTKKYYPFEYNEYIGSFSLFAFNDFLFCCDFFFLLCWLNPHSIAEIHRFTKTNHDWKLKIMLSISRVSFAFFSRWSNRLYIFSQCFSLSLLNQKLISLLCEFSSEQTRIFQKFSVFCFFTQTINRFGIFPICCQRTILFFLFWSNLLLLTRYLFFVLYLFCCCTLFHYKFLFVYARYSPRQHLLLLSQSCFGCTIFFLFVFNQQKAYQCTKF